ncbi:MAG: anthranilate synthase component I [Vulcanibacillus sp.]
MINMNYSKFHELSQQANMIPLTLEIEGDIDTPISLFKKLAQDKYSFLLESVEGGNKWGRYSFIGRNPLMTIKSFGDSVIINKDNIVTEKQGNPLIIIKNILEEFRTPKMDNLPDLIGGAVGYVGYDMVRKFENLPNINDDDTQFPDMHLILTDEIVVYDHVKQKILIIKNVLIKNGNTEELYNDGLSRLNEIKNEILENKLNTDQSLKSALGKINYSSNVSKEEFVQKVLKAKEYIRNGDIFQVVLSQRIQADTGIHPFTAYRALRSINPSPYMYYIDYGDYQIVGSSPELLVKVKDGIVETCPIAGTRPRGRDKEEDENYAQELLNNEKEKAEHLMLVDLARNDIGKIAKFGTVEVNQFMEVQKFSHVMHLVSNVIGQVREGNGMFESFISCLPAGTLSGAPKVRAMEIIDELENRKRGIYGGAVGYFGFNGNMDTCITIRTIVFKDNTAYIQAGAGIVADSDPESEYEETLRKAMALMETLNKVEREIS